MGPGGRGAEGPNAERRHMGPSAGGQEMVFGWKVKAYIWCIKFSRDEEKNEKLKLSTNINFLPPNNFITFFIFTTS